VLCLKPLNVIFVLLLDVLKLMLKLSLRLLQVLIVPVLFGLLEEVQFRPLQLDLFVPEVLQLILYRIECLRPWQTVDSLL